MINVHVKPFNVSQQNVLNISRSEFEQNFLSLTLMMLNMTKPTPDQHRALTLNPQTTDSQRLQLRLHDTWAHRLEFRKTAVTHSERRQTTCWQTVRRTAHSRLHRSFKNEPGAATGAQRPQMRVAYPGREDQRIQPESESNAVKPAQSIRNIPSQDSSVRQNNNLFLRNLDFHTLTLHKSK